MKRDTRQAYRRRAADTERMVDASVAEVKAQRHAEHKAAKESAAARRAAFDAKPAIDASAIRVGMWVLNRKGAAGVVLRLNPKTVRVDLGGGFEGRPGLEASWPLDSIIAAASPKEPTA